MKKNGDLGGINCMQPESEKKMILIFLEEKLIKENIIGTKQVLHFNLIGKVRDYHPK